MTSHAGPNPKLPALTNRQSEILQFIRHAIQRRGYAPTVRELGRQMKIQSPNGVLCHLKALQKKGYICREPNRSRAIQLTNTPNQNLCVPMLREMHADQALGKITGGEWIDFGFLFGTGHFVLRVTRHSWIDHHIAKGDFLVLRKGTPELGNSVLAIVNGDEISVGQVIRENGRMRLFLSGSNAHSISTRDAEIVGILVSVVRRC